MNKYVERLYNGIIKENPTFVLMLGTLFRNVIDCYFINRFF